ncbi:hypothetical protein STEG23_036357, partial [Scotinomys teguina]
SPGTGVTDNYSFIALAVQELTVDQAELDLTDSPVYVSSALGLKTGFICVALAILKDSFVDQAGLELTEISLPLPLEYRD